MPSTTFSVFLDENISSQATTLSTSKSFRKCKASSDSTLSTKENVNPLTGIAFDSQPPLKKRKPSSSSALKVKPLPSSSKIVSKSKKLSSSSSSKEKGRKRAVLGYSGNLNAARRAESGEAEQLQTALGNRRAYEFTVMPLADVTQAYDEGEATRAIVQDGLRATEDDASPEGMVIDEVTEEVRDHMKQLGQIPHIAYSIPLICATHHPRKQY
jgi:hypothetical protein